MEMEVGSSLLQEI
jgi:IS30 family transposase